MKPQSSSATFSSLALVAATLGCTVGPETAPAAARGALTAGDADAATDGEGPRFARYRLITLPFSSAREQDLTGLADDGTLVGYTDDTFRPFVARPPSYQATFLPCPGNECYAFAVSPSGKLIGGESRGPTLETVLWRDGVPLVLPRPVDDFVWVRSIGDSGKAVSGRQSIVFTPQAGGGYGAVQLADSACNGYELKVSPSGNLVAGISGCNSAIEARVWDAAGAVVRSLPIPSDADGSWNPACHLAGITDFGDVVGHCARSTSRHYEPLRWDRDGKFLGWMPPLIENVDVYVEATRGNVSVGEAAEWLGALVWRDDVPRRLDDLIDVEAGQPRPHLVRALAVNAGGEILASDEAGQHYLLDPGDACTTDTVEWKQSAPEWGGDQYAFSYRFPVGNAQARTAPAVPGQQAELCVGATSFVLPLQGTVSVGGTAVPKNSIAGLAEVIAASAAASDVNAVVRGASTASCPSCAFLDLYAVHCQTASCPPGTWELKLCNGACAGGCAGSTATNLLRTKTISQVGCAVTSLAMGLDAADAKSIVTTGGAEPLTPASLNRFMANRLALATPGSGGSFEEDADVDWAPTVERVRQYLPDAKPLQWRGFPGAPGDRAAETRFLDEALCLERKPVVVKVTRSSGSAHFVVVTAKRGDATDGSQYELHDPATFQAGATLKDYGNAFAVAGFVKDPPDLSELNVTAPRSVRLLLTDGAGRRAGETGGGGGVVGGEVEGASYFTHDGIGDPVTGSVMTSGATMLQVLLPKGGYTLQATSVGGGGGGVHRITIGGAEADGRVRAPAQIPFIGQVKVTLQQGAGGAPPAWTEQVTIDDLARTIADATRAELLPRGVGVALTVEVAAAKVALARGQTRAAAAVLRAMAVEVRVLSGKRIGKDVAELLLRQIAGLLR